MKYGDYAQHSIEGYRLQITKILGNKDATGQPLYEAFDDNGKKYLISETMLEPYREKKFSDSQIIDDDFQKIEETNLVDKENEIKSKTKEILKFLNITNSNDQIVQLENAMKIHKYICQNSTYTLDVMQEKKGYAPENVFLDEVYNGLISKRGVCTTDAIVFKYLLSEIGMHGDVIILESKTEGVHAATLVQLGEDSYYFDSTLERTIFEQRSNNPEKFMYCAAGLGQKEYGLFYTPVGVLPKKLNGELLPMPQNISYDSVPKLIIQSIGSQIQNLTFDDSSLDTSLENIEIPIEKKDNATNIISKGIRFMRKSIKSFKGEEK